MRIVRGVWSRTYEERSLEVDCLLLDDINKALRRLCQVDIESLTMQDLEDILRKGEDASRFNENYPDIGNLGEWIWEELGEWLWEENGEVIDSEAVDWETHIEN